MPVSMMRNITIINHNNGNLDDDDNDLSWFAGHNKFNWKHCNRFLCYEAYVGDYNINCDDGNLDDDNNDLSWFSGHNKFNWEHCNGLLLGTVGL